MGGGKPRRLPCSAVPGGVAHIVPRRPLLAGSGIGVGWDFHCSCVQQTLPQTAFCMLMLSSFPLSMSQVFSLIAF